MHLTHVLIATPTAGGVVKSPYATTLLKTVIAIRDAGWGVDLVMVDSPYIAKARNYFAYYLLNHSHFTHLLMIDSDMSFEGHVICRLLRSEKPFVAGAYTQRRMDLRTFAQVARNPELGLAELTALAMEYNVQPKPEAGSRQVRIVDGMCQVRQVALGCAVIRRDVFETLMSSGMVRLRPDRYLQKSGFEGPFYGFFDEITLDDGDILSEDYSFCKRWLDIPDNEIWAIVDEPIGHIGDIVYGAGAPYLNRLVKGKT